MVAHKVLQEGEWKCVVTLNVSEEGVTWSRLRGGLLQTGKLAYRQILSAQVTSLKEQSRLSLNYAKVIVGPNRSIVLHHAVMSFLASDLVCEEISRDIDKHLRYSQSHRPRRILLFINPMSGSQDSVTSFSQTVKPIFDTAGVTADVIVTEDEHHALRVMTEYDLTSVDAVVSMGGDGSYGHVFNAFMQKTMSDAGADMDDENVEPVTPRVAFGVLPAGSGCAIARLTNCCVELETCTLTIVLGRTSLADMGVIRQGRSFVRYSIFVGATGSLINAFNNMDKLRWLKKSRYFLTIPAIWWAFRLYDVEIQYRPVPEHQQIFRYQTPANASAEYPGCSTVDGPLPGWKTFRGQLHSLTFTQENLMKYMKWLTITPYTRPLTSTGCYRMSIDKVNSFWELLKLYAKFVRSSDLESDGRGWIPDILTHSYNPGDCDYEPNNWRELMEQINVTEMNVRFKSGKGDNFLHIDGEKSDVTDYYTKLYEKKYDMLVIDDELVSEAMQYADL